MLGCTAASGIFLSFFAFILQRFNQWVISCSSCLYFSFFLPSRLSPPKFQIHESEILSSFFFVQFQWISKLIPKCDSPGRTGGRVDGSLIIAAHKTAKFLFLPYKYWSTFSSSALVQFPILALKSCVFHALTSPLAMFASSGPVMWR